MKESEDAKLKRSAVKLGLLAVITLLLLFIPMNMVIGIIEERGNRRESVVKEVEKAYAGAQTISSPKLRYERNSLQETKIDVVKPKIEYKELPCETLSYKADIVADTLRRSIYDVIVYRSKIEISGSFRVTEDVINAATHCFALKINDHKGIKNIPQLKIGDKTYDINRKLNTAIELPKGTKAGDAVDFTMVLELKGTESIDFYPSIGSGEQSNVTTVNITSNYPHPSFRGAILPDYRNVGPDGFEATWNVQEINVNSTYDTISVKFVTPADPYQQSMRSAKYGILIIILVFIASLLVEFLTHKEINLVQYSIIGFSLILFYSLMLAFSEFIVFWIAYSIAALMTTGALILYFRAILKNRSAYMLGLFVTIVYAMNYMMLQMETYALLTGSLLLFILLCVLMYITANHREEPKHNQ